MAVENVLLSKIYSKNRNPLMRVVSRHAYPFYMLDIFCSKLTRGLSTSLSAMSGLKPSPFDADRHMYQVWALFLLFLNGCEGGTGDKLLSSICWANGLHGEVGGPNSQ
jgi:hypothetical protein